MRKIGMLALALVAIWTAYGVTPILAEEINIVGTGAGVSLLEALGKAFTKTNPNITVSVPEEHRLWRGNKGSWHRPGGHRSGIKGHQ